MTDPPPSPTRRQFVLLILTLAVAALVRFDRIGSPSLWTDELVTIEMAMGNGLVHYGFPDGVIRTDQPITTSLSSASPWWDIWTHIQLTTHPPIYFIILRWWMDLLGNGPAATRSLSVLFSLAAVAVFFDVCRLLHGPRVGLIAAGIMALAIGQLDIAQESRSYAMLILLEIAACDVLTRIILVGATRWRLVLLGVLLSAMALTHYLCVGVLAALAIVAILRLGSRDRRRTLIAFAVAAVLVLAAWGYGFWNQIHTIHFSDPTYLHEIYPHHFANVVGAIVRLPLQYLCGEDLGLWLPMWAHVLATLFVTALILRASRRRDMLLWTLVATATIALVAAIDLLHDSTLLQYSRYTFVASPALYAILANIQWPKKHDLISHGVVASLAILAILRMVHPLPVRQDFKQLATIIDTRALPDELLVFYNQSDWLPPGRWYVGYKYYSPASSHPWMTLHRPPEAQLLRQLQSRQTLWLIGKSPEIFGPIIFPGWRPTSVWHTTAGGVCLMRNTSSADSVR